MIEQLVPEIWTVASPLKIAGVEFGTRMTIVRIGTDELLLIAPCPIDDALAEAISQLGRVRALIAPNAFHHFYFADASRRYPEAARFLAEGVEKKIGAAAAGATVLSESPDPLWTDELDQCFLEGAPALNEVVFFHSASKTLILTDLCFNFDPAPTGWSGIFLRIMGAHGRLASSRLVRFLIKDRAKAAAAIGRILTWDFERIVVTHGAIVTRDGHRLLKNATADF